jgi:SAM-dependent methyltransferase
VTTPLSAFFAALHRVNSRHPWSHNLHYAPVVLRAARRVRRTGGRTALDVGCGTGVLVARLADVLPEVTGVEPDPATAARAERRTAGMPGVRILSAGFPSPDVAAHDLVSLVAVLHHLPLASGAAAVRSAVRPGGRLVIVGAYREERRDLPLSIASLLLNPVIGILKHPRPTTARPESMTAPVADPEHSYLEIRAALRRELPGIRMRRRLFWRYVAEWRAPEVTPRVS